MKKGLIFSFLLLVGSAVQGHLFSTAQAAETPQTPSCFAVLNNVHYGQQDAGGSEDVDSLQRFLASQGYFPSTALGTGHFGPITLAAVRKFQLDSGVPSTGFVGPLTRAAIQKEQPDCGSTVAAPTLYSISPASGPTGTTVSIQGFGFSASNTILIDGMVAQRDVPIASSVAIACTTDPSCHGGINQTLTFSLPSFLSPDCPMGSMCPMYLRLLEPGHVTVTVRNDGGVSNGLPFIVST